jgi:hypothetical protein
MIDYVIVAPTSTEAYVADVFFNVTGTLAEHLPDAIYYCYTIPEIAFTTWTTHFQGFINLDDFEGAFV